MLSLRFRLPDGCLHDGCVLRVPEDGGGHRSVPLRPEIGSVSESDRFRSRFVPDGFRNENAPNDVPRAVRCESPDRCRVHRSVRRRCSRVRCAVRFSGCSVRCATRSGRCCVGCAVRPDRYSFLRAIRGFRLVRFDYSVHGGRVFRGVHSGWQRVPVFRPCGIPKRRPLLRRAPLFRFSRSSARSLRRRLRPLRLEPLPSKRVMLSSSER